MKLKKRYASITAGLFGLTLFAILITATSPTVGEDTKAPIPAGSQTAERLVIRYSAGGYELVSRIPLLKILPPSTELPAPMGEVNGTWFEVRSDKDETIYRRRMASPQVVYTEIPTGDDPAMLNREEIILTENTFSVLVPAGENAASLVFFGSKPDPQKRAAAATEIGRIGLR